MVICALVLRCLKIEGSASKNPIGGLILCKLLFWYLSLFDWYVGDDVKLCYFRIISVIPSMKKKCSVHVEVVRSLLASFVILYLLLPCCCGFYVFPVIAVIRFAWCTVGLLL